jgi:flagellar basal body-associated protein FliL
MRKVVSLTVLLAIVSLTVAQDKAADKKEETKKDDPNVVIVKGQLPKGWKSLNLTEKQKTDILKTRAKYAVKRQTLEDQLKALKTEEQEALEKLLTDVQKQHLKEMKK